MGRFTRTAHQVARALRKDPTPAERQVWQLVRNRQVLGLKFRRQHPIGRFVVDFYCAERRLILELDGAVHEAREGYDRARDEWLRAAGYEILRLPNAHVTRETLEALLRDG